MYISLKYKFAWIWRFLIVWSVRPIEIGFYKSDLETELWSISLGNPTTHDTDEPKLFRLVSIEDEDGTVIGREAEW